MLKVTIKYTWSLWITMQQWFNRLSAQFTFSVFDQLLLLYSIRISSHSLFVFSRGEWVLKKTTFLSAWLLQSISAVLQICGVSSICVVHSPANWTSYVRWQSWSWSVPGLDRTFGWYRVIWKLTKGGPTSPALVLVSRPTRISSSRNTNIVISKHKHHVWRWRWQSCE